jgi:hypothetical protein
MMYKREELPHGAVRKPHQVMVIRVRGGGGGGGGGGFCEGTDGGPWVVWKEAAVLFRIMTVMR